jgi:hypothetical protein
MSAISIKMPEAKLAKLNTRTEGNQADPIPAEDMKFHGVASASFLFALLGAPVPAAPADAPEGWDPVRTLPFWNPDGTLCYLGLSEFGSWCELSGAVLEFGDPNPKSRDRVHIEGVKVKKFQFKVVANWSIELTLTAQARLDDKQATAMRHKQQKNGSLLITTDEAAKYDERDEKQEAMQL